MRDSINESARCWDDDESDHDEEERYVYEEMAISEYPILDEFCEVCGFLTSECECSSQGDYQDEEDTDYE